MSSDRSLTRRPMLLALSSAILVAIVALRTETPAPSVTASPVASPSASPQALPDSIGFELEYAGLGAEGVDLVWRGRVAGPVPGLVTIRMEYAGGNDDRRMPIWPVNAWLLFSADDYRSSFCAELSGSMNWHSRVMRVTGLVSDGAARGVPIEQRVYLRRSGLGGTATVHFLPWIALRTTWAQHD
jgi:hypothetical protein